MNAQTTWAIVTAVILAVLLIVAKYFGNKTLNTSTDCGEENLKQLVDQANGWLTAARQDSSVLLALLHVTTALAKINTAIDFEPNVEKLSKNVEVDVAKLRKEIKAYHAKVMNGVKTQAPNIALRDNFVDLNWIS